jgi:hypothetical protein
MKNSFAIIISLFILLSLQLRAETVNVSSFEFKAGPGLNGSYISLFYVSARPASFGTSGQQLKVFKILKGPKMVKILNNGALIENVEVLRSHAGNIFNYVVYYIHPRPTFGIKNLDGTIPRHIEDPYYRDIVTGNNTYLDYGYFSKKTVTRGDGVITVNLD